MEENKEELTLIIEGMTCAACVFHVESAISKLQGVSKVAVNLITEKARLTYIPQISSIPDIKLAVRKSGYSAHTENKLAPEYGITAKRLKTLRLKTAISALLTTTLILMMYVPIFENFLGHQKHYVFFIITSIIIFGCGKDFYLSALHSLRNKTTNMNTLVSLGTSVAYGYSTLLTILIFLDMQNPSSHTYFDMASIIITLVLVGRYIESRMRKQTTDAIRSLVNTAPITATVLRDNSEVPILADHIIIGEIVIVYPGETIPVDGIIITGVSMVNESMLSGESMPVTKKATENVFASTINTGGKLTIKALSIGSDTVHARIIQLVEEAQESKAPVQRFADKASSYFVPMIIASSIITFALWLILPAGLQVEKAIISSISVLIIACPCAMGLATPTAIMVTTGIAAKSGILYRDAATIEMSSRVNTIVFDKTGTLTLGVPEVIEIITSGLHSQESLLTFAASIESESEHIIAKAIIKKQTATNTPIPLAKNVTIEIGKGASGFVDGHFIQIGNWGYVNKLDSNKTPPFNELNKHLAQVYISIDNNYAGNFLLNDQINPRAIETVQSLKKMGIEIYLLSGDHKTVTENVGQKVGIKNILSSKLPHEKLEFIRYLQNKNHIVAMVGDGINDGPALMQAEIGIALNNGSDMAIEAAKINLNNTNLLNCANSLSLARYSLKKIKQNLFWAVSYNITLVPIAAGALYSLTADIPIPYLLTGLINDNGLLNPIAAAAAMGFSSISVIANSLTLKRFKLILHQENNK